MGDIYQFISHMLQTVRTLRIRSDARDGELKTLCTKLMAYCILIRDHLQRIDSAHLTLKRDLSDSLADKLKAVNLSIDIYAKGGIPVDKIDMNAIQDLLGFLVTWEDKVNAQYPDDCSWVVEDYTPQDKTQSPPFGIWKAAQAVFNVLLSCQDCECDPSHDYGARLRIGTYCKPISNDKEKDEDEDDDEINFEMFLSIMEDWQEVRVHSARKRTIQFAAMEAKAITAQTANKRVKTTAKSMKIERLCETIFKMQKTRTHRLELRVNQGQLFKLRSKRSDQLIDLSKIPVSLDEIIRGEPQSFTEKTKRILMVLLSHAVLHLLDTPWLQSMWNSSKVIFFRTKNSEMPLKPFLDTSLSSYILPRSDVSIDTYKCKDDNVNLNDLDPDDHPYPTIVALAVMLMEIFFVAPFDELAQRFDVRITGEMAGLSQYLDADMVFRKQFWGNF
jgi:hypothetical protein